MRAICDRLFIIKPPRVFGKLSGDAANNHVLPLFLCFDAGLKRRGAYDPGGLCRFRAGISLRKHPEWRGYLRHMAQG